MFTGIVEELGTVRAVEPAGDGARVVLAAPLVTSDARHGDSIAVNGCCLTVTDIADGAFAADVMAQTLRLTTLGGLAVGDRVNLERAMPAGGRFGGHVVQGHVDGVGTIVARQPGDRWEVVTVALPVGLGRYVVPQGSITLDGTSLTVSAVRSDEVVEVSLIPTTLEATTLGRKGVGSTINVEVDILAKYVERLVTR